MTHKRSAPRNLIDEVFREAEEFCQSAFDDDVTMLAVKRS